MRSVIRLRRDIHQDVPVQGVRVATVAGVNTAGQVLVQLPGTRDEVVARLASSDPVFSSASEVLRGQRVLLVFEGGDFRLPLIVGVVRDCVERSDSVALPVAGSPTVAGAHDRPLTVNGRRLVFDGKEEIVFSCGQASITLRADGSIVIKGRRLLSRASEVNKIRGASVQIN